MEIGVSQSISTHKNTTGSKRPGYSSTTTRDIIWNNFHIFLDVETIFTLLGFQLFLFVFFIQFSCYYWLYLINQHKGEGYTLAWSPSGIFLLLEINKSHTIVLSTKIWIVDFRGVLLIYNFHIFWGADKSKNGNLNICINVYIWIKPKDCWDEYYRY